MRDIPHSPVALYKVAHLFGTLIAETILASVPVRARNKAGHMGASDLIKALQNLARRGPTTYAECQLSREVFLFLENRWGGHRMKWLTIASAALVITLLQVDHSSGQTRLCATGANSSQVQN